MSLPTPLPAPLRATLLAVTLALGLAGCGAESEPVAVPTSPAQSQSPDPSASPSESPTGPSADELSREAERAVDAYREFVSDVVDDTITATEDLVAAIKRGSPPLGRQLYAASRFGWEQIRPVAASIPGLEARVEARESEVSGVYVWTGWHRIEKALFVDKATKGMSEVGDLLLKDLEELRTKLPTIEITPASMAAGALDLMEEIKGGMNGREEQYSRADLSGFAGRLEGARTVFDLLRPIAAAQDQALVDTLSEAFGDLRDSLEGLQVDGAYPPFDKTTETQRANLRIAVNAVAEPLAKLGDAVT